MNTHLSRRRFIGATGAGLAGAAVAGLGWKELTNSGQSVAEGAGERRNIVLIVIDSLRADHLGCYGNEVVRTPAIDALADESVRFTRVFPEAMPTVPARRSILTGRRAYPFRNWQPWYGLANRAGWSPIMPGTETLVTVLRRHGYWTTYVSDNPFLTHSGVFEPFRDTVEHYVSVGGQRGERRPSSSVPISEALGWIPPSMREQHRIEKVRQYLANNGRAENEPEQAAARVFASAERRLGEGMRRRPFLMVVDSFDPHEFWTPPRKYLDLYGDPDYHGPEISDVLYTRAENYLSEAQLERVRAIYAADVTMVDRWLGHFLEGLHDRKLERETVVALVSDHGLYLGEHGLTGKSDSYLHPELIQVPLLLRDPDGRGAGEASDYYANTVDLAPTLMTMAGVRPPHWFEGVDISPIADGDEPSERRPFTYGGYSNFSFVRDGRWHFVTRNDRDWQQLFDLSADPEELNDVSERHPDVVERMWRRLLGEVGKRPPRYSEKQLYARDRELRPR